MRNLSLLCVLNLVLINGVFAQLKTIEFKDGTKIEYEVVEHTADNASRGLIRLGFGAMGVGYQYANPNKFEASAGFSMFSGGYANLLYSLYTFKKERNVDLPVKEVSSYRSTKTYYIAGEKVINTNFIGVHLGARYFNESLYKISPLRYATDVLLEESMLPYTGTALMAGVGKFKTHRMKYFVNEVGSQSRIMRSYTRKTGMYLDLMYYASLRYDLYNPLTDRIEPYDEYSKIGFLLMFESSNISTDKEGKKGWGRALQFGIGKGPAGLIGLIGIGLAI